MAEFVRAVARVCESPKRYPIEREPGIRRTRLRRFPFKILYRESAAVVQILAVAHDRRRPIYWLGRL